MKEKNNLKNIFENLKNHIEHSLKTYKEYEEILKEIYTIVSQQINSINTLDKFLTEIKKIENIKKIEYSRQVEELSKKYKEINTELLKAIEKVNEYKKASLSENLQNTKEKTKEYKKILELVANKISPQIIDFNRNS